MKIQNYDILRHCHIYEMKVKICMSFFNVFYVIILTYDLLKHDLSFVDDEKNEIFR